MFTYNLFSEEDSKPSPPHPSPLSSTTPYSSTHSHHGHSPQSPFQSSSACTHNTPPSFPPPIHITQHYHNYLNSKSIRSLQKKAKKKWHSPSLPYPFTHLTYPPSLTYPHTHPAYSHTPSTLLCPTEPASIPSACTYTPSFPSTNSTNSMTPYAFADAHLPPEKKNKSTVKKPKKGLKEINDCSSDQPGILVTPPPPPLSYSLHPLASLFLHFL